MTTSNTPAGLPQTAPLQPAAPSSTEPITLAELLTRDVSLQWYEAVAIAQGLCEVFVDSLRAPSGQACGLSDATLGATGEIRVLRLHPTQEQPASWLARIAHDLLSGELPVQLRLVVSQAMSPAPTYGSIEELSNALQYFERPGREAVLQAVYKRWHDSPPASSAQTQTAVAAQTESVAPIGSDDRRKRTWLAVALTCGGVIFAGTIIWRPLQVVNTPAAQQSPNLMAQALQMISSTRTGLAKVGQRLGMLSSGASQEPPSVLAPPKNADRTAGTSVSDGVRSLGAPRVPVSGDRLSLPSPFVEFLEKTASPPSSEPHVALDWNAAQVYTVADLDVTPPVLISSSLSNSPGGARPEDLGVLELVISETGDVESAKLQSAPTRLHDIMILHAAKAWRFEPALKAGRPVRYRSFVRFTDSWTLSR